MKDFKELKIEIPEGCFEGNCYDCRYADWSDKDQYGRVYCRGSYGGYNKPSDRNGCFHFKNWNLYNYPSNFPILQAFPPVH